MYILALDDEVHSLEALVKELNQVFPNGEIQGETRSSLALDWAKTLAEKGEKLSYAFLDIQIRGDNGLEIARMLKELHPGVILFFCTAYSEYAFDAFGLCAKGYLLKPILAEDIERVLDEMVTDWREEVNDLPRDIRIQTFGNFGVYLNDSMVTFKREKAKELLAYLVDRHGSPVTTEQIAMILWEDEPYGRALKNKTTTIISSLRSTLREYGIEDILIKSWNNLALDVSKVKCDAYDFEKGDWVAINSFRGEYLSNYSWAEVTLGYYTNIKNL